MNLLMYVCVCVFTCINLADTFIQSDLHMRAVMLTGEHTLALRPSV